jgi:hypothetical protein
MCSNALHVCNRNNHAQHESSSCSTAWHCKRSRCISMHSSMLCDLASSQNSARCSRDSRTTAHALLRCMHASMVCELHTATGARTRQRYRCALSFGAMHVTSAQEQSSTYSRPKHPVRVNVKHSCSSSNISQCMITQAGHDASASSVLLRVLPCTTHRMACTCSLSCLYLPHKTQHMSRAPLPASSAAQPTHINTSCSWPPQAQPTVTTAHSTLGCAGCSVCPAAPHASHAALHFMTAESHLDCNSTTHAR